MSKADAIQEKLEAAEEELDEVQYSITGGYEAYDYEEFEDLIKDWKQAYNKYKRYKRQLEELEG